MAWYAYILYGIFIIASLLLIGVVLLQPGKGDAAIFGGGGSQTVFGPSGAQKPLERVTLVAASLFMILSFVFTIPGITSPRSAAAGIKETPAPAPAPKTATPAPAQTATPAPKAEEKKPEAGKPIAVEVDPTKGSAKPADTAKPADKSKADDKKKDEKKK
jgi:preprotein translocase subunit SecG